MIVAGLLLLAIGAVDLIRRFAPRPWIGYFVGVVLLLAVGLCSASLLPAIIAVVLAAGWLMSMPLAGRAPASFWPVVVVAVLCVGAVAFMPARTDAGLLGDVWRVPSPLGPVPFDVAVLTVGVVAFLLESGNLIVRVALGTESSSPRASGESPEASVGSALSDESVPSMPSENEPSAVREVSPHDVFKGGRLIGPLERVLVFLLTITGAYPVLAAVIAAKGIVRFPEISRDGEKGARAEYFLVGSLVSWAIAFGGAVLVWWGFASR